jgi:hypothetical protein
MSRRKREVEGRNGATEDEPREQESPAGTAAEAAPPGTVAPPSEERNQPVHAIRLRNVRAAIWANTLDSGVYYNVTLSRSYRDQEGNWHTTESFGREDLLLLAKVADLAHTWIWAQIQSNGQAEGVPF